MNIGINGMGRIGRTFFRVLFSNGQLQRLKAINDIMPKEHLAYLLQYDTVRGKLPSTITSIPDGLEIDGHVIRVFQESDPAHIPWREANVQLVVEASGVFANKQAMHRHIDAGAQKCLLTTTGSADVPMFIMGVNENQYSHESLFSIGSCTVNGTAPLLQVLQAYVPRSVYVNVIHAYSTRQNILDAYHPELRRSRASADNIIPLNVNLDKSLERLFPSLHHHISSITTRVPVPCGVLADLSVVAEQPPVDTVALQETLKNHASTSGGLVEYTSDPLVSSDVIHNPHSLVIDHEFVRVIDNHIKVLVWFDNEWGFSNRIFDWVNRLDRD